MGTPISPQVSVLLAAYNGARWVERAIRSVLAQRGVSFELLIGDDASTDRTWSKVSAFGSDGRVRAWRFRKKRGAAVLRNVLVRRSLGRYLAICDQDDVMLPGHLRRLARVLDRRPRVGVAYGDLWITREGGNGRVLWRSARLERIWDVLHRTVWDPGTMIRRSVMQRARGYRSDLPFLFDYDLFLRLAEVTRFQHVEGRPRYLYHDHPGSLSDRPPRAYRPVWRRVVRNALLRRYRSRSLSPWLDRIFR